MCNDTSDATLVTFGNRRRMEGYEDIFNKNPHLREIFDSLIEEESDHDSDSEVKLQSVGKKVNKSEKTPSKRQKSENIEDVGESRYPIFLPKL